MTGIYQIQSKKKPDRIYIGSAANIQGRWEAHLSSLKLNKHYSKKLQRHYNKYGRNDLQFSVLICCDKLNLIENEQFFLDSYKPYFNSCPIAGNSLGFRHSEESRKKMSLQFKGRKQSPETIAARIIRNTGKKRNAEQKERSRLAQLNRSESFNKAISERMKGRPSNMKGKHHSEETKRKIRISNLGKQNGEKSAWFGKRHTKETILKMRKAAIEREAMKKIKRFELINNN